MTTPDPCQAKENWKNMNAAERLEFLDNMINSMLAEWGYPPVNVEAAVLDNAVGTWNYDENTVKLDYEKTLESEDFEEVLDTAMHEAAHAARDLEHGEDIDTGGHRAEAFEFVWFGEELEAFAPGEFVPDPSHREAYTAGEQWAEALLKDCEDEDDATESMSDEDMPDGDWDIEQKEKKSPGES